MYAKNGANLVLAARRENLLEEAACELRQYGTKIDFVSTAVTKEQDVKNFWPKIKPGGLIAGDDYLYEGVRLKVHEFVKKHRDEISEFAHPDLKKENTGNFFKIYKKNTYEK